MSIASAEMRAYYAARAPYYDAVYLAPERQADIAFLVSYLQHYFLGRTVLEIACGTGYWTQHIAQVASRMSAIDRTQEPVEFAKLRPGAEGVVFRMADAYDLPKALGVFEAGFAGLWFSHVPIEARAAFLQGFHELLLPGARVVLIDNNEVQCRTFPIAETDVMGNTYQYRELKDGTVHRVLKNFPTQADLQVLLGQCARNVKYRNLDNFWLVEYEVVH